MNNHARRTSNGMARKKILIVDDDKCVRDSLTNIFLHKGLDVHLSLTGEGALEKISREDFDLVTLDFSLPDIDGLEVLKQLRKTDTTLPVIFMTGCGSEIVSIKAFKLGVADYFIKPFNPKMFEDSVLEILSAGDEPSSNLNNSPVVRPTDLDSDIESSSGVSHAVKYIKENYGSRISLDKISKVAGFSRSHFMYRFKEVMGITFKDYLNQVRIINAEEALCRNKATVSEIAYAVGFNSLRQFERVFKNVSGKSPIEFRKEKNT